MADLPNRYEKANRIARKGEINPRMTTRISRHNITIHVLTPKYRILSHFWLAAKRVVRIYSKRLWDMCSRSG